MGAPPACLSAMSRSRPPSSPPLPAVVAGSGQVRIIGGKWRNTRLQVPQRPGLRPTADRVRETLFNWLQPHLPGTRVLDLFAGSGVLGLEALSRGAAHATLVERDPGLASAITAAVQRLDAQAQASVVARDALAWLQQPVQQLADIAFVDPPFADGLWGEVLQRLPAHLGANAWLYVEAPHGAQAHPGAGWIVHREGTTREVGYVLYRRQQAATLAADSTL